MQGVEPADSQFSDFIVDVLAVAETEAAQIKAGLVSTFKVHPDAVDVAMSADNTVAYALVFLDADTARRLAKLKNT